MIQAQPLGAQMGERDRQCIRRLRGKNSPAERDDVCRQTGGKLEAQRKRERAMHNAAAPHKPHPAHLNTLCINRLLTLPATATHHHASFLSMHAPNQTPRTATLPHRPTPLALPCAPPWPYLPCSALHSTAPRRAAPLTCTQSNPPRQNGVGKELRRTLASSARTPITSRCSGGVSGGAAHWGGRGWPSELVCVYVGK